MEKKLTDFTEIVLGASIARYSKNKNSLKQKMPVLYCTVDEFYTNEEELVENIDSKYLTQKGDVIFKLYEPQIAISIDENSIIPENVVVSSKFVILKPKGVEPKFLAELLNSSITKNQIQKFNQGELKLIRKSDLDKLKFEIPRIEEQKKFVKACESINDKIVLHKKLLKNYIDFKEGIVQKTQKNN
ncbi:MAG: restriction endonuclease subunit S [Methanobrevibacter sp.]|nr:restriction endonuclease subunit S [Methanobrevibacter sp.]